VYKHLFIVVIDDSPTVCQLLDDALSREGHQVKSFHDPVLALRSILTTGETPRPDLLLVDLSLPMISGYEVVRLFKRNTATMHIPIIVISRLGGIVARLRALLAGADGHLEKSLLFPEIIALIQRYAQAPNRHET
jgi:chemotaxis family two-component system response regulator PixG